MPIDEETRRVRLAAHERLHEIAVVTVSLTHDRRSPTWLNPSRAADIPFRRRILRSARFLLGVIRAVNPETRREV
jgi:hypothetical protein